MIRFLRTMNGVFLSLLSSPHVTFLPKRVVLIICIGTLYTGGCTVEESYLSENETLICLRLSFFQILHSGTESVKI